MPQDDPAAGMLFPSVQKPSPIVPCWSAAPIPSSGLAVRKTLSAALSREGQGLRQHSERGMSSLHLLHSPVPADPALEEGLPPQRHNRHMVVSARGLCRLDQNLFMQVNLHRGAKLRLTKRPPIPITPVSVKKRKHIADGDSGTTTHFDDTTELAHKYLIIGTGSVTNCQYQHMWSYQLLHAVPKTPHQPYNTNIALAELVGHAQTALSTNPVAICASGCLHEFYFGAKDKV